MIFFCTSPNTCIFNKHFDYVKIMPFGPWANIPIHHTHTLAREGLIPTGNLWTIATDFNDQNYEGNFETDGQVPGKLRLELWKRGQRHTGYKLKNKGINECIERADQIEKNYSRGVWNS